MASWPVAGRMTCEFAGNTVAEAPGSWLLRDQTPRSGSAFRRRGFGAFWRAPSSRVEPDRGVVSAYGRDQADRARVDLRRRATGGRRWPRARDGGRAAAEPVRRPPGAWRDPRGRDPEGVGAAAGLLAPIGCGAALQREERPSLA